MQNVYLKARITQIARFSLRDVSVVVPTDSMTQIYHRLDVSVSSQ